MGEKKRRLAAAQQEVTQAKPAESAWLQQGLRAHQQGNLPLAIGSYERGLALAAPGQSEFLQLQHYLGLAWCQAGQIDRGLQLLQQASAQASKLPAHLQAQMHFNLGNALHQHTSDQDPLPHWQQAHALHPSDNPYAIQYAQALHGRGAIAAACDVLRQLRLRGDAKSASLDILAQWCYQQNQLEEAVELFALAVRGNPSLKRQRQLGYARHSGQTPPHWQRLARQTMPVRPGVFRDMDEQIAWLDELDLHVIDNFLLDPHQHRQAVLRLPFQAMRYHGQNYPGQQTDGQVAPQLMQALAQVVQRDIKFISPDNASCRLSYAEAIAKSDIHADNESGDSFALYAGVLYLNLPQDCQGGTTFWRHAPSGICRRLSEAQMQVAGFASFRDFQQQHLPHNLSGGKFNPSRHQHWQQIMELPMQFNRLVVYRGDFFHAIGELFGNSPENGRLVQLFFFETL